MMKSPLELIIYFNISKKKKKRNSQIIQNYDSDIVNIVREEYRERIGDEGR